LTWTKDVFRRKGGVGGVGGWGVVGVVLCGGHVTLVQKSSRRKRAGEEKVRKVQVELKSMPSPPGGDTDAGGTCLCLPVKTQQKKKELGISIRGEGVLGGKTKRRAMFKPRLQSEAENGKKVLRKGIDQRKKKQQREGTRSCIR